MDMEFNGPYSEQSKSINAPVHEKLYRRVSRQLFSPKKANVSAY